MKNLLCYIWFQVIISWMDLREGNRSYDTLKATYKGHQITISWSALISSRYLIILYATHADDTNFPQVTKYFLVPGLNIETFTDFIWRYPIHICYTFFDKCVFYPYPYPIFLSEFNIREIIRHLSFLLSFFFYLHITFWKIYSNLDAIEKNILLIAWKKIELSFQKNRQWNVQQ